MTGLKNDRKRKKRRRKKGKKTRKGHPRKSLKFDDSCQCGVVPGARRRGADLWRIVNGEEAEPGSHPWAVSLESEGGSYYCGGSIISNRYIMTAAHCVVKGEKIWIHIGDHDKTTSSEANSLRILGKAKPHPRYNEATMENDIAIVKLTSDIDFSSFNGMVGPVCLARKGKRNTYAGERLVVAGWGVTKENGNQATKLREATVMAISNEQCANDYSYDSSQIDETMLCNAEPGKDACQGDSGGPVVFWDKKRGRFLQVGVVSWGIGCARPDFPGVSARVSKLERWVLNQAKKKGKFCLEK